MDRAVDGSEGTFAEALFQTVFFVDEVLNAFTPCRVDPLPPFSGVQR